MGSSNTNSTSLIDLLPPYSPPAPTSLEQCYKTIKHCCWFENVSFHDSWYGFSSLSGIHVLCVVKLFCAILKMNEFAFSGKITEKPKSHVLMAGRIAAAFDDLLHLTKNSLGYFYAF